MRKMTNKELNILKGVVKRYVDLAESGDAGFWNPHEEMEIKAAEELIKKHESTRQQTQTPHPSDRKGAHLPNGGDDNESQKGMGEGKDRESVEG